MAHDVITIGRIGIDLYPTEVGAPLQYVDRFARFLGGSPTNVAVGLARLGRRSAVITRVGDDPFGRFAVEALDGYGVDTAHVRVDPRYPTPIAVAELRPPDHFPLWFFREPAAPDMQVTVGELPLDVIREAGLLWVTGGSLSAEPSRGAVLAAIDARGGRAIVLDLDHRPSMWPDVASVVPALAPAIAAASVVVGNESEFVVSTGIPDALEAARSVVDGGAQLVALKRGPLGVTLLWPGGELSAPGFRVEVVNGLGAGDAFGAALCHGILADWSPERLLATASAAGAIVASRLACSDAMPTLDELDAFVMQRIQSGELTYTDRLMVNALSGEALMNGRSTTEPSTTGTPRTDAPTTESVITDAMTGTP